MGAILNAASNRNGFCGRSPAFRPHGGDPSTISHLGEVAPYCVDAGTSSVGCAIAAAV